MSNIESLLLQNLSVQSTDPSAVATCDNHDNIADNFKNLLSLKKAKDQVTNESEITPQNSDNFTPSLEVDNGTGDNEEEEIFSQISIQDDIEDDLEDNNYAVAEIPTIIETDIKNIEEIEPFDKSDKIVENIADPININSNISNTQSVPLKYNNIDIDEENNILPLTDNENKLIQLGNKYQELQLKIKDGENKDDNKAGLEIKQLPNTKNPLADHQVKQLIDKHKVTIHNDGGENSSQLSFTNNTAALNEEIKQSESLTLDTKLTQQPDIKDINIVANDIDNSDLKLDTKIISNTQDDNKFIDNKDIKTSLNEQETKNPLLTSKENKFVNGANDFNKEQLSKTATIDAKIAKQPLNDNTKNSLLSNKTAQDIEKITQTPQQNKTSFDKKNDLLVQEKVAILNKKDNTLPIGDMVSGDFEGSESELIKPINELNSLKDKVTLKQDINNNQLVVTFKTNVTTSEFIRNNSLANLSEQLLSEQIQKEQLLNQVSLSVKQGISSNKSEVKVNIYPEHLGPITVKIEFNKAAKLQINNIEIMTRNHESLAILKNAAGELKESLIKFDNNKSSFELKFKQDDSSEFNNPQQQKQQHDNNISYEDWDNWKNKVAIFASNDKKAANVALNDDVNYQNSKIREQIITDEKIDILV